jgi:hypothetical protein
VENPTIITRTDIFFGLAAVVMALFLVVLIKQLDMHQSQEGHPHMRDRLDALEQSMQDYHPDFVPKERPFDFEP